MILPYLTVSLFSFAALEHAYKGKLANNSGYDHNFHWYDVTRDRSPFPIDAVNAGEHGTHVTGIAVGGVNANIGVAPEAKFISCRAFDENSRGIITYSSVEDENDIEAMMLLGNLSNELFFYFGIPQ